MVEELVLNPQILEPFMAAIRAIIGNVDFKVSIVTDTDTIAVSLKPQCQTADPAPALIKKRAFTAIDRSNISLPTERVKKSSKGRNGKAKKPVQKKDSVLFMPHSSIQKVVPAKERELRPRVNNPVPAGTKSVPSFIIAGASEEVCNLAFELSSVVMPANPTTRFEAPTSLDQLFQAHFMVSTNEDTLNNALFYAGMIDYYFYSNGCTSKWDDYPDGLKNGLAKSGITKAKRKQFNLILFYWLTGIYTLHQSIQQKSLV